MIPHGGSQPVCVCIVLLLLGGTGVWSADYYVDYSATGGNNGTSWADAWTSFTSAMMNTPSGCNVYVAEGTYTAPSGGWSPTNDNLMFIAWDGHDVVLSGDINGDDAVVDLLADPCGHRDEYLNGSYSDNTRLLVLSDRNVTLWGFTLKGGASDYRGGATDIDGTSAVTFYGCLFTQNYAEDGGGCIYTESSHQTTLTVCQFIQNSSWGMGSVLYAYGGDGKISVSDCLFQINYTIDYHGCIMLRHTPLDCVITNCIFDRCKKCDNSSSGSGIVADYDVSTSLQISNCIFKECNSEHFGAALCMLTGAANVDMTCDMTNCLVTGCTNNYSTNDGVAISSLIRYDNTNSSIEANITNCTIADNHTLGQGHIGGWCYDNDATCSVTINLANSILWGNTGDVSDAQLYIDTTEAGSDRVFINADYCCWDNSDPCDLGYSQSLGTGNLLTTANPTLDPNFVDAGTGDYTLMRDSPCSDAGDNSEIPAGITTDLAENPRRIDNPFVSETGSGTSPIVDMGAYECLPVIFVDKNVSGGGDNGISWTNAYDELSEALDVAVDGSEVWVAQGTYVPDNSGLADPRDATFQLASGVDIFGGFPTYGDDFAGRNPETYVTTLSGDQDIDSTITNNCYSVVTGSGADSSALLDGFTITGGNANGTATNTYKCNGGGMYIDSGSPAISNCTFTLNYATGTSGDGGGLYANTSESVITNCIFDDNIAADSGGGLRTTSAPLTLNNCLFTNNSAYNGAGMRNYTSNSILTDCTFVNNTATTDGGGMYIGLSESNMYGCIFSGNQAGAADSGGGILCESTTTELVNCLFSGNSAGYGAGFYDNTGGTSQLTNCTFSNNAASSKGGGVRANANSNTTLINCILWGNTAPLGPQIGLIDNSLISITYSDIEGGQASIYLETGSSVTTYSNNIDTDPLFADADGTDNIAGTDDDDLHLKSYSPCIDAGDPSGDYTGQKDIDDEIRVLYDDADMGIDEVWPIAGDFEPDGDVDIDDFDTFTGYWLNGCSGPLWCNGGDIDQSGTVDMTDYVLMADHWLAGI